MTAAAVQERGAETVTRTDSQEGQLAQSITHCPEGSELHGLRRSIAHQYRKRLPCPDWLKPPRGLVWEFSRDILLRYCQNNGVYSTELLEAKLNGKDVGLFAGGILDSEVYRARQ